MPKQKQERFYIRDAADSRVKPDAVIGDFRFLIYERDAGGMSSLVCGCMTWERADQVYKALKDRKEQRG